MSAGIWIGNSTTTEDSMSHSRDSKRFGKHGHERIYIYEFVSVSDEQVAEDSRFVEVAETDHVLHAVDGGGVHRLNVGGVLRGDPVLLQGRGTRHGR